MKRPGPDRVVTGLNLDRKALKYLDDLSVETGTNRSHIVNYLIERMIFETREYKKLHPDFKKSDMFYFLKPIDSKSVIKRKPRAA
jgi:hypothetical protein